ncbi:MAG TPA: putative LPS assembly protein LptD, partial [Sphingobacteriaceae bacterium]
DRFGFYRNVPLDSVANNVKRYSIFEPGGAPSPGKQANLNFSFDNNIEAKVRSTKDTVNNFVKVPILQGLSFNGYYNFVADSFKLSTISFTGRTSFFKQKVGINFRGELDPYRYVNNRRVDQLAITTGKLAKLTNFGISTDYSLNINSNAIKNRNNAAANRSNLPNGMTPQQADQLALVSRDPYGFVDFNVPWDFVASYSFNLSYNGLTNPDAPQPKTTIVNTLNFNGNFNVTPLWKIGYTSGYDFKNKDLTMTQFTIYRDLHCWDLSFSWIPFGIYKSYTVDLKVRSSILQDLKLSRRKSHFDTF